MQAVFRLVKDYRVWPVDHLVRHFCPAVGRQTMHKEAVRLGQGNQIPIDLEFTEYFLPFRRFFLLPH